MALQSLLREIRSCRICIDAPSGPPLPHAPRPVLRVSRTAKLCIAGQAPGTRVHASGKPFTDPSGDRLRAWLDVDEATFYDTKRIAIVAMGFCFPGLDAKGGDLPPRPECARHWRAKLFAELSQVELVLLVGAYAQKWHLGRDRQNSLTETVRNWRRYGEMNERPAYFPLPHPSWRNSGWLKRNPWFENELLPELRAEVRRILKSNP